MQQPPYTPPELEPASRSEVKAAEANAEASQSTLQNATEQARRFAAEHPWMVVGAAAGVGFAIGAGSRTVTAPSSGPSVPTSALSTGLAAIATRAAFNFVLSSLLSR